MSPEIEEPEKRKRFHDCAQELDAEFIDGEIIPRAASFFRHAEARTHLSNLLYNYAVSRGAGVVYDQTALCSFPRNDYQPDVVFFGPAKAATITPDTLQFPPPDLVCEVLSPSTEKRDRGVKFQDYEAHGVGEYWLVDPETEVLEQYLPGVNGLYELRMKSGTGQVTSKVVPGFSIPVRAIFDAEVQRITLRDLLS